MTKEKLVLLQNKYMHYRKEVFNRLDLFYDLILIHSGPPIDDPGISFKSISIQCSELGPFYIQKRLLHCLDEVSPDVVIAMFDIRWISILRAMLRWDKKIPWIWWGLDKGSYWLADSIKMLIAKRKNPVVFYSKSSQKYFSQLGLPNEISYLANNTIHVEHREKCYRHSLKDVFINVGSLDARKENRISIEAIAKLREATQKDIKYLLIGKGPEHNGLRQFVSERGYESFVIFLGQITSPEDLVEYYRRSIATLSFGQAGLAVLQSMAFGVPFVTKKNAISGGEKSNIQNNVNGLLVDDDIEKLKDALLAITSDLDYARQLGKSAYDYYTSECTIDNMVEGFKSAISSRSPK